MNDHSRSNGSSEEKEVSFDEMAPMNGATNENDTGARMAAAAMNADTSQTKARRDAFKKMKDSQPEKTMDFDDLLPYVGEFGRYQKLMIFFICLPACIPCGFHAFNQLFMSPMPPHWCKVPDVEKFNLTEEEAKTITIPYDPTSGWSQCTQYVAEWSEVLPGRDSFAPDPSWPKQPCTQGWIYNTSIIYSSIVIDKRRCDVMCELALMLVVSTIKLGSTHHVWEQLWIYEEISRPVRFLVDPGPKKKLNLITKYLVFFFRWLTWRLLSNNTLPGHHNSSFTVSLELVGPSYRSFVTVMTCLFYVGGMLLLAGVAYIVRDWTHLCIVTSAPFFTYVAYWWFLPESPRWLLSQGRLKEASTILNKMAEVNKTTLPESFTQNLQARMQAQIRQSMQSLKNTSSVGFTSMWKTPNMRLKTILITAAWFANETVYVGLSYYGPAMGDNEYMAFFLSCLVEVPSYLLCWIVMDRWGRRWILGIGMIVGGVASVCTVLMPPGSETLTMVLYLTAKFAESAAFLIIYPFAGEIYPTEIRGIGIGFSAYVGGIGLVVIPFVNYLGTENRELPLVIMGIISVIGGIAAFRLPETLQQKLPNTMEEGEEFGKDFAWKNCLICIPEKKANEDDDAESAPYEEIISLQDLDSPCPTAGPSSAPCGEASPLNRIQSKRSRLTKQTSIMQSPVATDSSGAIKMTFWV
ncbi:unnamed protein product, partial [Meganyctiphanes norvegica]